MSRPRYEPVQAVKARRDAALAALLDVSAYVKFLGVQIDRRGNELSATLPFDSKIIGNPIKPALHGGAIGAFLELTAQLELMWTTVWDVMEEGGPDADAIEEGRFPDWPKVINITVDYLRSGLPRDAYARARIVRRGRRYATVQVEAWQDEREKPFASATVHFLMPQDD